MPYYNYGAMNYGYPYNTYYPVAGQPMGQNQMVQPTVPQTQPAQVQPQIQNGGFVTVHSESEARNYPVAPGTSVTFKHETEPYCYEKTMGFSQFEAPRFEKFRLVKEEEPEAPQNKETPAPAYASQEDLGKVVNVMKGINDHVESINDVIENMKSDIDSMKGDLYGLSGKKRAVKKAEVSEDDA